MLGNRVASQQEYEDAKASLLACQADVMSAEADLESALIDLNYTRVTAPVSGQIGKSEITEGAYVRKDEATLMATVRQNDPVYVDMTQSSANLVQLKQALHSNELHRADSSDTARVTLALENGADYDQEGIWKFTDTVTNANTSSVTIRAVFPNPDNYLLPGMFVKAFIVEARKENAILIPQAVVMRDTKGEPYVYIAGKNGTAEQKASRYPVPWEIGGWSIPDSTKATGSLSIICKNGRWRANCCCRCFRPGKRLRGTFIKCHGLLT